MLIGDFGKRKQAASRTAREYNTFHTFSSAENSCESSMIRQAAVIER
jgi:hypothetical protein